MFVNFTNHSSEGWGEEQRKAANLYGEIVDFRFPNVPPEMSEAQVEKMADEYAEKLIRMSPNAVLCQGEMTMAFAVVSRLMRTGIPVFCACSERNTEEITSMDGTSQKTSVFRFVQFRRYI